MSLPKHNENQVRANPDGLASAAIPLNNRESSSGNNNLKLVRRDAVDQELSGRFPQGRIIHDQYKKKLLQWKNSFIDFVTVIEELPETELLLQQLADAVAGIDKWAKEKAESMFTEKEKTLQEIFKIKWKESIEGRRLMLHAVQKFDYEKLLTRLESETPDSIARLSEIKQFQDFLKRVRDSCTKSQRELFPSDDFIRDLFVTLTEVRASCLASEPPCDLCPPSGAEIKAIHRVDALDSVSPPWKKVEGSKFVVLIPGLHFFNGYDDVEPTSGNNVVRGLAVCVKCPIKQKNKSHDDGSARTGDQQQHMEHPENSRPASKRTEGRVNGTQPPESKDDKQVTAPSDTGEHVRPSPSNAELPDAHSSAHPKPRKPTADFPFSTESVLRLGQDDKGVEDKSSPGSRPEGQLSPTKVQAPRVVDVTSPRGSGGEPIRPPSPQSLQSKPPCPATNGDEGRNDQVGASEQQRSPGVRSVVRSPPQQPRLVLRPLPSRLGGLTFAPGPINAVLQALAHLQHIDSILFAPDGKSGPLTNELRELFSRLEGGEYARASASDRLRSLLSTEHTGAAPSAHSASLKTTTDSAVLLRSLLTLLQREQLRVSRAASNSRPRGPPSGSQAQQAAEAWERFVQRESSALTDCIYTQRRITTTCTACKNSTVAFDAVNMLHVPIPSIEQHAALQQAALPHAEPSPRLPVEPPAAEKPSDVQRILVVVKFFEGTPVLGHFELEIAMSSPVQVVKARVIDAIVRHGRWSADVRSTNVHFHFSSLRVRRAKGPTHFTDGFLELGRTVNLSGDASAAALNIPLSDVLGDSGILVVSQLQSPTSGVSFVDSQSMGVELTNCYMDVTFGEYINRKIVPINGSFPYRMGFKGKKPGDKMLNIINNFAARVLGPLRLSNGKVITERDLEFNCYPVDHDLNVLASDAPLTGRMLVVLKTPQSDYRSQEALSFTYSYALHNIRDAITSSSMLHFRRSDVAVERVAGKATPAPSFPTLTPAPAPARSPITLDTCLRAMSIPVPVQGECMCCNKRNTQQIKYEIWNAPELLVLCLGRFRHVTSTSRLGIEEVRMEKAEDSCEISEVLDLSSLEKGAIADGERRGNYRLCSVVEHSGSYEKGYYKAFCKVDSGRGPSWCYFSDSFCSPAQLSTLSRNNGHVFIYARNAKEYV